MRCFVGLCVMLVAAPALAFEGELEAKTFGDADTVEFQIYVSSKRDVRMDTTAKERRGKPRRFSYVKPATGKYDYMIDHEQKQAIKLSKERLASLSKQASAAGQQQEPRDVKIEQLGKATVAGQSTRHVRVTDKKTGEVSELWLSDAYPADLWRSLFTFQTGQGPSPTAEWAEMAERKYGVKPGFMMKMMSKDARGGERGMVVTRMQEKKVAADKFVVPSGYEVMSMPEMPAGSPGTQQPSSKEEYEKLRDSWMKRMREQPQ